MQRATVPAAFVAALSAGIAGAQVPLHYGDLPKSALPADPTMTRAVVCADFDRDRALDLAIATDERTLLYLNDGQARFTDATARVPDIAEDTVAMIAGDVDGDGHPDLVLGNRVGQDLRSRLYLWDRDNDRFVDAPADSMPISDRHALALALADFDGDGDNDLIVGRDGPDDYYVNDGRGVFTRASERRLSGNDQRTTAFVVGDLDGDGDLDLVAGHTPSAERSGLDVAYYNDGRGALNDRGGPPLPRLAGPTRSLALGDVDRDGDADLVIGSFGATNRLLLNGGAGVMTPAPAAWLAPDGDETMFVALADVDGDDDLDLMTGNGNPAIRRGGQNRLYLNDGRGRLVDATAARLPEEKETTVCIGLCDLDGDRDPDLVIGNAGSRDRLRINLLRQVTSVGEARTGAPYTLEFYAKPGFTRQGQVVFPFLAAALGETRTWPRIGSFHLDLRVALAFPLLPIDRATGKSALRVDIPPNPWLVGRPLFTQGVFLDLDLLEPAPFRMSNINGDAIR